MDVYVGGLPGWPSCIVSLLTSWSELIGFCDGRRIFGLYMRCCQWHVRGVAEGVGGGNNVFWVAFWCHTLLMLCFKYSIGNCKPNPRLMGYARQWQWPFVRQSLFEATGKRPHADAFGWKGLQQQKGPHETEQTWKWIKNTFLENRSSKIHQFLKKMLTWFWRAQVEMNFHL